MQAVVSSPASWLFAFLAIVVAYLLPALIGTIGRVGWLALPGDQCRGTAGLTAAWPSATAAAIPEPLLAIPGGLSD